MSVSRKLLSLSVALGLFLASAASLRPIEVSAANDPTDYSSANTCYNNKDKDGLFNKLSAMANYGAQPSSYSYSGLWGLYKSIYVKDNGKMMDYYSDISNFTPGTDQAGSYSKEGDVYNREHSIPKSWWGGGTSNQGSDPVIVIPTDGKINSVRSNYALGYVANVTEQSKTGYSKLGSARSGYGYSGTVFEPNDEVKGDLARIHFYAATKYKSTAPNWTADKGNSTFSSSGTYGLTAYATKLFAEWNALDPVSEWERTINNRIQEEMGYRNPFIDHPEYGAMLWNGDYEPPQGQEWIELSSSAADILVGDELRLTVTASSSAVVSWYSNDYSVVSLSNATSSVGDTVTVTGLAAGDATITAKITLSGVDYTATCAVSVTEGDDPGEGGGDDDDPTPLGDCITLTGADIGQSSAGPLDFEAGGCSFHGESIRKFSDAVMIDKGGYLYNKTSLGVIDSIKLTYNQGGSDSAVQRLDFSTSPINEFITSTPHGTSFNDSTGGTSNSFSPTGNYGYFNLSVTSKNLQALTIEIYRHDLNPLVSIATTGQTTDYSVGDEFSYDGTCTATYYDGSTKEVTPSVSTPDMESEGTQTVTLSYTEGGVTKTTSYEIELVDHRLQSLTTSGQTTEFYLGDDFVYDGVCVAHFADGREKTVTPVVDAPSMASAGTQYVYLSYTEDGVTKTTYYSIQISIDEPLSIETTGQAIAFNINDDFVYGGVATVHYQSGRSKVVEPDVSTPDLTSVGSKNVTVSYSENGYTVSTSYQIYVRDPDAAETHYVRVTSTADLVAGDNYVLACPSAGFVAGDISSSVMASVEAKFSKDESELDELPNDAIPMVLGGSSGAWTFSANKNLLGATAVKKLAWGSGTTTWSITIDGGNATIQNGTDSYGRFLYNVKSPRFTTYTSDTNASMLLPALYHEVPIVNPQADAEDFALSFLLAFSCDSTGQTAPVFNASWTEIKAEFNKLSADAKAYFAKGAAEGIDVIDAATERYDYVVGKYHYEDFMNRSPASLAMAEAPMKTSSTLLWIVLAGVGVFAALSIGVAAAKRKKEN